MLLPRLTSSIETTIVLDVPSGSRPHPPVGTARVAIAASRTGAPDALNVFWLNLTSSAPAAADLAFVLDAVVAAYFARFTAFIATGVTISDAKTSWLYATNSVLEVEHAYSDACTGGTGIDNFASSYVLNWHITDYYRGGKPRSYITGVPQSVVTDGRSIAASTRANLAAAAVNFMNDVNALSHGGITAVTLGTVRFQSHLQWLAPPVFKAYTGASTRGVMGTQRRRLG